MSLKNNIKNKYWHINWIIPLVVKYRSGGKGVFIKKAIGSLANIKVVKGKNRDISYDTYQLLKEVEVKHDTLQRFFYYIDENKTIAVKGNIISNFTLDYSLIINESFVNLANQAIEVGGEYGKRAQIIKKAITNYYNRVLDVLNDVADTKTIKSFEEILDRKANHFDEGLQRILFFNQILWQTRHRLNGIGRIDKMLGKLYQNDIDSGYITKNDAYSMIKSFYCCLSKNYEYKSSNLFGDIGQIIVLGGREFDGRYFYNELTSMFLKVQAELRVPDPKILIRVSKDMPDSLAEDIANCMSSGTGSPVLSNDDVIIEKLVSFGYQESDSYNYSVSACWEPFVPGVSLDQNNINCFDFAQVLASYLKIAKTKEIITYKDLLNGFDSFLIKELKSFISELDAVEWAKDPLISMFTPNCNLSKKDISEGGAKYNNYGFTTVGMGATCDSLLNIKELCFDKKEISFKELETLRENNYKTNTSLQKTLKERRKHYGHDEEESINLTNHIIEICNGVLAEHKNRLGGKCKFGLSSPSYITSGSKAEADIAGRLNREPYSTHISADDSVYTELVGFASEINYNGHCINGNVVDFFMQPNIIHEHREQFISFIKGAIRKGFYQLQINVMDSSTLIDAKKHPDKHKNLIVRVWGFSAYFNDLPDEYKDRLIQRALENERQTA